MMIFQKVTLKYLKKNKVRTLAAVAGILLSSAMICAVAVFLSSMNQYVVENAIENTGDWQVGILGVDWPTCESLLQEEELVDTVYCQRMGYSLIQESYNEYKKYYYVLGIHRDFMETMSAHITAGRFPRKEREVLIPESLYEISGIELDIGTKTVWGTGTRTYLAEELGQDDPYIFTDEVDCERLDGERTDVYTVVGVYDDLSYKIESASAPGYTVFAYFEDEPFVRDRMTYDVYFKLKDTDERYRFAEETDWTVVYNSEVLGVKGILQQGSSPLATFVFLAFVIVLILLGAIALIYNMFSISVSERTKQFALLASVGATQKQIQKMIWYESFVLSSIGIPFGILLGVGGVAVALHFIGDKFQAFGYSLPMRMQVSWEAIVISVLLSLATVLISAWVPSKRAKKATIIENIKQNQDIYQTEKKEKQYTGMQKMFGVSGLLAGCYCSRSQKKYKATILSLGVSFMMFVLVSFFMEFALKMVEMNFDRNSYDLAFKYEESELKGQDHDSFMALMNEEEHITEGVFTSTTKYYRVELEKKYLSEWALQNIGTMTSAYRFKPDIVATGVSITFVQDEAFLELLKKYDLNEEEYMNMEHPKAIVVDGFANISTNQASVNLLAGDECRVSFSRGINGYRVIDEETVEERERLVEMLYFTLEGGKVIYERPYYLDKKDALMFLYPESLRKYYTEHNEVIYPPREGDGEYHRIRLENGGVEIRYQYVEKTNDFSRLVDNDTYICKFLSTDYGASYEVLKQIAVEHHLNEKNFMNNAEQIEKENNLVSIIQVLSTGFLVLMTLVAAINVFNTISTNISLRRREFAVLKSIGMTEDGLHRMMFAECLLLGARAMLWGLLISLAGTLLLYLVLSGGMSISYSFPFGPIGISVLGIFAIVLGTMLYIVRARKQENVIETLKNENI